MTTDTRTAEMPAEEFTAALLTAGRLDTLTRRAATYLLAQTELPHRRDFRGMVELLSETTDREAGTQELAAYTDWPTLEAKLPGMRLSGGDERLVRLAISYATGTPVDLRDVTSGHGSVHIRYVIEAAIIATGAEDSELYTLAEGPGLARIRAFNDKMLGTAPAPAPVDLDALLRDGASVVVSFIHGQDGVGDENGEPIHEPVDEGYHAVLREAGGRQFGEGHGATQAEALAAIRIPDPSEFSDEPPFDPAAQPLSDPGEYPAV